MAEEYKRVRVTMCGSTRFRAEFTAIAEQLSWQNKIVLKPEVFSHAKGQMLSAEQEAFLDTLHKCKIAESDEIFVVNVNGYIGKSTKSEIAFAAKLKLPIYYLVEPLAGSA